MKVNKKVQYSLLTISCTVCHMSVPMNSELGSVCLDFLVCCLRGTLFILHSCIQATYRRADWLIKPQPTTSLDEHLRSREEWR